MKAMILAAGRGERMGRLTDNLPKPLLEVNGKPLIVHHIERLVAAGVHDIVINVHYLGNKIQAVLGDGTKFNAQITYSLEPSLLDTGGGIYNALPWLGPSPFIVLNADVWTAYDYTDLRLPEGKLAHLVMVDNPPQHSHGDFVLQDGLVQEGDVNRLTFSGIRVCHPDLFRGCRLENFSIIPLLKAAMQKDMVSGEHYQGVWRDIGTPDRLEALQLAEEAA